MHLRSCGTLVIFITSTGDLLLYFTVFLFSFHIKKKKISCRTVFGAGLFFFLCAIFYTAGVHVPVG